MRNSGFAPVKKKLSALWADSRTYGKRLLLSGSAMLAACFTFLFYGPLEMVAFSADSLAYTYQDVALPLALTALAVFLAGSLLLALLRGKIFNYAISILFAVTVAGYLQAAFLNGGLGTLTGDSIDWAAHRAAMWLSFVVWVSVIICTFLLMYLHRDFWKKAVVCVCALLVIMQLTPTVGIFLGAYGGTQQAKTNDYYLSEDGMYEFSENDNIFVFVLDRLDYSYIENALKEDPAFLDGLDGFTSYTNAISAYARTRPALVHLMTGYEETAYVEPVSAYYRNAWTADGKNILQNLQNQGYTIDMYSKANYLFSDPDFASQYVKNLRSGKYTPRYGVVLRKLSELSAYRYAPTAIKPFYWADTNYYNSDIFDHIRYEFNDSAYAQGFADSTAKQNKNSFKLYHFFGPHAPYTMNADGSESETKTTVTDQTLGSFANLLRIFDKMKDLGIYEDAAIIITGDHGNAISDRKPIQKATRIGLFYKPSGSAGTPLATSSAPVCTDNIPATILKAAGADYSLYGRALDEIGEDEELVRYTYKSIIDKETYDEIGLYTYEITGNAADFDNWKIIDYVDIEHNFY